MLTTLKYTPGKSDSESKKNVKYMFPPRSGMPRLIPYKRIEFTVLKLSTRLYFELGGRFK